MALSLYLYFFSGPDLASPRSALATAQERLRAENWAETYDLLHPDFRSRIDDQVKFLLRFIARRRNRSKELRLQLSTSAEKRFTALLEGLKENPETSKVIDKYAEAEVGKEETTGDTALLTLTHDSSLPFKKILFKKEKSTWSIGGLPGSLNNQSL